MKKSKIIILLIISLIIKILSFAQSTDSIDNSLAKVPLEGFDQTWMNGNDRRDSTIFHIPYFTPSILIDINATHSFNNPIDHTVVGSTSLSRNDEMVVSAIDLGGDFTYGNAHARIMTQFGIRPQIATRLDLSTYHGQYNLIDANRDLSEVYAGYHFDVLYGLNVDFGLFMSYIGLNSYYQQENWEYQASYTSDNTPFYFNGARIQVFPSKYLKTELWLINGWSSYGSFNNLPGIGINITWCPTERLKLLTNDYWGADAIGYPGRQRIHTDNSVSYRYYNDPRSKKISRMAFCIAGDAGLEKGNGVNGFSNNGGSKNPAQYFLSWMVYNKIWFAKNKLGFYCGGGWMTNPGRYLVIPPSGDASPLPNPYHPTQTAGTHPFPMNPGDPFTGWDCSAGLSWTPNQSIELKAEWVHREATVNYFAGPGGVTSPSGYTYTALPTSWAPDLTKSENRVIMAILFRL